MAGCTGATLRVHLLMAGGTWLPPRRPQLVCTTETREYSPRLPRVTITLVRVTTRLAWIATVLVVASACDKAHASGRPGAASRSVSSGPQLDLRSHPDLLFEVFGDPNDPRMIPIAAIEHNQLQQISLDTTGWRQLDAAYLRSSKSYDIFEDGHAAGTVQIRRGMWQGDDPLYALPGCQLLTPMAAVRLKSQDKRPTFTVEYLASTATLGHERDVTPMPSAEVERIARAIGSEVAKTVGISQAALDSLDFHAIAFASGNGRWPTIVAGFIDPAAENPVSTQETTTHLILIADRDSAATEYHPTYTHRVQGPLASSSFRRFFDHLDVNSDGVDEIFLEGWQFGSDTYLSVLSWKDGKWEESYRTRTKWCLD